MSDQNSEIFTYLRTEHYGQERAVPIREIAAHFAMPRRSVEKACENLRREGLPVISVCKDSGGGGVFVARTMEELSKYKLQVEHRIAKMSHNFKVMYDAMYERLKADAVPCKLNL